MIEFKLQPIQPGVEWTHVFRSPDDICFEIQSWRSHIETCESLSSLLKLRKHISDESPIQRGKFTLQPGEDDNQVKFTISNATVELSIETTYDELQTSFDEFLENVFRDLDRVSSDKKRKQAFDRGNSDYAKNVYQDLISE